jgi:homoserine kinase type II
MNLSEVVPVISSWGLNAERSIPAPLYGSPERSLRRMLFETAKQKRFILEEIDALQVRPRNDISRWLWELKPNLCLAAYEKSDAGEFVVCCDRRYYQLQPFIFSHGFNQATYYLDAWRGEAMAGFLLQLKNKGAHLPRLSGNRQFLPRYIESLCITIAHRRPGVYKRIRPVADYILSRYDDFSRLPRVFCHGDFHPGNVLWGKQKIAGVIDWEFSGFDFLLYDAACVFGCIASEGPEAAEGPMAHAFYDALFSDSEYAEWESFFPLAVIALRFPWLSEWLRKKDEEMVGFEVDFLYFLANHFSL